MSVLIIEFLISSGHVSIYCWQGDLFHARGPVKNGANYAKEEADCDLDTDVKSWYDFDVKVVFLQGDELQRPLRCPTT